MTETLRARVFLAFAFCLVLIAVPAIAQQPTQERSGDDSQLMWRDDSGNLHFRDEDGNYMIDADASLQSRDDSADIRSDSQAAVEDDADVDTETTIAENRTDLDESDAEALPATAGELPLLQLFGMLSLVGAGAARLLSTRR